MPMFFDCHLDFTGLTSHRFNVCLTLFILDILQKPIIKNYTIFLLWEFWQLLLPFLILNIKLSPWGVFFRSAVFWIYHSSVRRLLSILVLSYGSDQPAVHPLALLPFWKLLCLESSSLSVSKILFLVLLCAPHGMFANWIFSEHCHWNHPLFFIFNITFCCVFSIPDFLYHFNRSFQQIWCFLLNDLQNFRDELTSVRKSTILLSSKYPVPPALPLAGRSEEACPKNTEMISSPWRMTKA